jgi:predicted nucleotidyltransferase
MVARMDASKSEIAAIASATLRDHALIVAFRGGEVMPQPPDKIASIIATTRALQEIGAAHALIGGIAVGVHSGVPRATVDTDFAVVSTVDRERTARALMDVGFRRVGSFPHSLNLRHASGEPVQLAFDPMFDAMIVRAERVEVGGIAVPIVRKEDLITMKERAAADPSRRKSKRLRDQADIELLKGDVPEPDEGW